MPEHHIFAMPLAKVYPLYVKKAERKNRTEEEVDEIISCLTDYDQVELQQQIERGSSFETFFTQAPAIHSNSSLIKHIKASI